jgi:hypothetical protein
MLQAKNKFLVKISIAFARNVSKVKEIALV